MARAVTVNRPRGGKTKTHRAVGYVRRSTDRQEQSIPDQKKAIEKFVLEHDLRLLRFYVDDAISGTSTDGRHAFQAMIADAQRRTCDFAMVIVYDVKRFGRVDNDEAGYYRHVLRTHGVEVQYVSENFSGDGTDDLLRPVKQWQAREESKDLAKVVIRGLLSKATSANGNGPTSGGGSGGWWMGGAPPFGYDLRYESQAGEFLFYLRYMRDSSKQMFDQRWKLIRTLERRESISVSRRDRCKLVPSEKGRVQIVQRIFQGYVQERRGFMAIADSLNRDDVPSPRGPEWAATYSGKWSLTTVRGIIVNPVYSGDMVWNRKTDARFFRICNGQAVERKGVVGRRLEWNDESDWIITKDAHPPLVARRIWESAKKRLQEVPASQMQRGINPRTGAPAGTPNGGWTGPKAKFLLSGLCRCSRCGSRYEGLRRYGKQTADGERQRRLNYGCGGYIRRGRSGCTLGAIPKDALEEVVTTALIEFYQRYAGKDAKLRIAATVGIQTSRDHGEIKRKRNQLDTRKRRLDRTTRNLIDNITSANRTIVDQRLQELQAEHDQIDAELDALDHLALTEREATELTSQTVDFVATLASTLREGAPEARQALVRCCMEEITIDRDEHVGKIAVRVLPTITGGPVGSATEEVTVKLPKATIGRPKGSRSKARK